MLSKFSALLIAGLSASSTAQMLARLVPQFLEERAVRPAGGWGLTATVCPNDLDVCGGGWCCPTSLTCVQTGGSVLSNICCPGTVNCIAAFTASPTCADDTWSLWDKSTGGIVANGYFCCAPGQAGLLDGTCIASDAISSPTQEALQLAPGGSVLSTPVASTSTKIVSTSASIATVSETSTVATSVALLTSSTPSLNNSTITKSSGTSISTKASSSAKSSASNSVSTSAASASSAAPTSTKASEGTRYENFLSLLFVQAIAGLFAVNLLLG